MGRRMCQEVLEQGATGEGSVETLQRSVFEAEEEEERKEEMKTIGIVLAVLMLAGCLSISLVAIPNPRGLREEMEVWVYRYGEPDGFQVRSLRQEGSGLTQVEVIFVWVRVEAIVVFQFFDGTWYMVHNSGGM